MKKNKKVEKFKFDIDFQESILHYTIKDPHGVGALSLYDDSYFTLLSHSIIAHVLKSFHKKRKRIPSEASIKESLRNFFTEKKQRGSVTQNDYDDALKIIKKIYTTPIKDSDEIEESIVHFARYIQFKKQLENVNINDYSSYSIYADKLKEAQNIAIKNTEDYGTFLISGINDRAHNRDGDVTFPTPYWQLNKLLNGGGTEMGNIIMVASQAKRFKTGALINIARGYLRMKKVVLYIDFENGAKAITTRSEQSIMQLKQDEVLSGEFDKKMMKQFRKYKRMGAEMIIKRFPSGTTFQEIQTFTDSIYLKFGLKFNVVIADYLDLAGANSGQKDETQRIGDVYMDAKNFANHNQIESFWTASHVTREAGKRRATKYEQNDLAKCIDKIRHVDIAIGLQESEQEIEAGVLRLEIMEQRNGPLGKCLFWVDIPKQNLKEFNKTQVDEYYLQIGGTNEETKPTVKKPKKNDL